MKSFFKLASLAGICLTAVIGCEEQAVTYGTRDVGNAIIVNSVYDTRYGRDYTQVRGSYGGTEYWDRSDGRYFRRGRTWERDRNDRIGGNRPFPRPGRGGFDRGDDRPGRPDFGRGNDRPGRPDFGRGNDRPGRPDFGRGNDRPGRGGFDRGDRPGRPDFGRDRGGRPGRGDGGGRPDFPRNDGDRGGDRGRGGRGPILVPNGDQTMNQVESFEDHVQLASTGGNISPTAALAAKYRMSRQAANQIVNAFENVKRYGKFDELARIGLSQDELQRMAAGGTPSSASIGEIARTLQVREASVKALVRDVKDEIALRAQ